MGKVGPLTVAYQLAFLINHFCFQNTTLRAVAMLSFSKFLCVSSQFCDAHHELLFRILEASRDANIRSNIAIALGYVAISSSMIDENSDELYRGLSDSELAVALPRPSTPSS
jgi:condensin complex subunit 1